MNSVGLHLEGTPSALGMALLLAVLVVAGSGCGKSKAENAKEDAERQARAIAAAKADEDAYRQKIAAITGQPIVAQDAAARSVGTIIASTAPPTPSRAIPRDTFEGVPLGASSEQIREALGTRLIKLQQRELYKDAYVEFVIPEYDVGGVTFRVYFQMNNATDRLRQVLLKKAGNRPILLRRSKLNIMRYRNF